MAFLFTLPQQVLVDSSGQPYPGAKAYFFAAGTTNFQAAYTDLGLSVAHPQPVVADANGRLPAIYLNNSADADYRVQVKTSADVLIYDQDNIPRRQPITQSQVGEALYPQTTPESNANVTPSSYAYPPGDRRRYSSLQDAAAVCQDNNYTLELDGASRAITQPVVFTGSVIVEGVGSDYPTGSFGTIITNTANDDVALQFKDVSTRVDRARVRDLRINHEAANAYAIHIDGPYGELDNVSIDCNLLGYGGVLIGDENSSSSGVAWQSVLHNCNIEDYKAHGIRINTTGHTHELRNCSFRSSVNGAHGAYINTRNVHIYGGQYGANNTGGINIYFYNVDSTAHYRGSVNDVVFENVGTGEYAVVIDGATNGFNKVELNRLGIQLSTNLGTLVKFGFATECVLNLPSILSPTGGGKLAEWGASSVDCRVICDLDAAKAPVTVHASATRPVKEVVGRIAASAVTNITTAANLTVRLRDGVVELPTGFTPVHNGTAWNYWLVQLSDDGASSFTPPTKRGVMRVSSDKGVSFFGAASYNVNASGTSIIKLSGGAGFEALAAGSGSLSGSTGVDARVTVSAHTDGKVYLENREGGVANYTVLFESVANGSP